MMLKRLVAPTLTILGCALLWYGYESINVLRGTPLWELRHVLLGCAGFVLLTLVERISARLGTWGKLR